MDGIVMCSGKVSKYYLCMYAYVPRYVSLSLASFWLVADAF